MASLPRTIGMRTHVSEDIMSRRTRSRQQPIHFTCLVTLLMVAIAIVAQTVYATDGG